MFPRRQKACLPLPLLPKARRGRACALVVLVRAKALDPCSRKPALAGGWSPVQLTADTCSLSPSQQGKVPALVSSFVGVQAESAAPASHLAPEMPPEFQGSTREVRMAKG